MSQLALELCDPRDREAEIKDLFARNDRVGFDAVFERAYRKRAEHGLRSWIGLADNQAVMHISVTPMPFAGGGRTMMCGVLGDLMVDASHRDFWAPVRLMRKMVSDLKRAGEIDCLMTTTVADAESVFKAGGFKTFGSFRRYVLPLSRPYLTFARIRSRVSLRRAKPDTFHDLERARPATPELAGYLRPVTNAAFYETRIPRSEFSDGTWLAVEEKRKSPAGWALLSRSQDVPEVQLAD